MSHEDSRYLSPEHRQLLRTGARLPLTLTLLDHADYMDARAERNWTAGAEAMHRKSVSECLAAIAVAFEHMHSQASPLDAEKIVRDVVVARLRALPIPEDSAK